MVGLTDSPTLGHMYQPPASPGPYNTVPRPPHPHNRHQPQHHQHEQPPSQQQQMLASHPFGGCQFLLGTGPSNPQDSYQQQQQHHHHHQRQHTDQPDQFGGFFNIPSEADLATLSDGRYLVGYMPPPGDADGVGGFGECYAQGCKNG